ncbi:MAG: LCP family protein [Oscillospiraceae bacterium]|nr:LCP family protein [Oscillospiraceae bacterium]
MALFKKKKNETGDVFGEVPKDEEGGNDAGSGKERVKRVKKKKNIIIRIVALLLSAVIISLAVVMVMNMRPVAPPGTPQINEKYRTPKYLSEKTMNILVCGIDADSELEGDDSRLVSMTDVIMVINFDREADKATVLQIPRDTYVGDIVPYGKINGLYQWGVTDKKPQDGESAIGIEPLIRVINEQFRLTIDCYVLITMEGFRNAVDLIGGIDIVLAEDEDPIDFEGHFVIRPGVNHLNGELSEVFVRYRNYDQADIDRLRMQERFMEALMRKLFELSTSELISVTWKIRDYLVSDLDVARLIAILKEVKQLSMENIRVIRVPGEPVPEYGLYAVNVFSVHKKQLADLLNRYMRPYQDDVYEADLGAIEIQHTRDDFVDSGTVLGQHGS